MSGNVASCESRIVVARCIGAKKKVEKCEFHFEESKLQESPSQFKKLEDAD